MKRAFTVIIILIAIVSLSTETSAQKFVFNVTEYSFFPDGSEGEKTTQKANSEVSIERKTGDNYTIVVKSDILIPYIYNNVKCVDYIDDEGFLMIGFALTDTHYLVVGYNAENQYGAIMELNPDNLDDGVAYYTISVDDNAGQTAFYKEFSRLNNYVLDNYDIDKIESKKTEVKNPVLDSKNSGNKTITKPIATGQADKEQKQSIPGLPEEIDAVPLTELKSKVLRESKGEVQSGLVYRHNYTGINEPISITALIEHPLGILGIDWQSLSGEKQMFETLVKHGIGFEGVYKHKFDKLFSPSTTLLLKKTLALTPKVDFGNFRATWGSFSAIPQMYLDYDNETGEAHRYPSFSYTFKLSDMPSGYSMDKKKGLKAIEKSFENFLVELRQSGIKVTKRKDYKGHYRFEKGDIKGEMYLRIDYYMVQYTEMVIVISRISR